MTTRPPVGSGTGERKQAHPVPDPDSRAMDDRGTRPYREAQKKTAQPEDPAQPGLPDPENGNHIGDPEKPEETIRASDAPTGLPADDDEAPSDAPTIIREQPQRH